MREDFIEYFHNIKSRHNIKSNVEVFRHALKTTEEYDTQDLQETLHPQLRYVLQRYCSRPDVREKFSILNEDDLFKLAIDRIIVEIEAFVKERSLVHWDIRSSLQGMQKDVALAFKELHITSQDKTVKFSQMSDKLKSMSKKKLKEIMDEFVFQSLVTVERFGEQIIYHAD